MNSAKTAGLKHQIVQHLPFLRRYARALTGSQAVGDEYIRGCLETLLLEPASMSEGASVPVELFRLFHKFADTVETSTADIAKLADPVEHLAAAPFADGQHRHDGRHADNDPQQRQGRAQEVDALVGAHAAHQFVEADPQESCHKFDRRDVLAIALWSSIGGNRLFALLRQTTVTVELQTKRRREALLLRISRLAVDNNREDAISAAERLEAADLLVDIFAPCGIGRALRRDQRTCSRQRG